ncbi:MAG: hypothetical protein FWD51_03070, partial [Betaproteobacteria bacterium]|nr:hypothetical protein [Betaproteobacteria bacterium]
VNSAIFHLRPPVVNASSQTHFNPTATAVLGGRLDDFHGYAVPVILSVRWHVRVANAGFRQALKIWFSAFT